MKLQLLGVLIVIVFAAITTAQENDWTEVTDSSKNHLGDCYSDTDGLGALEKNEKKRLQSKCVEAECTEGGVIVFKGCHVKTRDSLCRVTEPNLDLPFPDCCPYIMCA